MEAVPWFLGWYALIWSRDSTGTPLAAYSIRSYRIFHSNKRAFVSAGIHDWELKVTNMGAEFRWWLAIRRLSALLSLFGEPSHIGYPGRGHRGSHTHMMKKSNLLTFLGWNEAPAAMNIFASNISAVLSSTSSGLTLTLLSISSISSPARLKTVSRRL